MSILSEISHEKDLVELERLYITSLDSHHLSPRDFIPLKAHSPAALAVITFYRQIVKDFASQLWKDLTMVSFFSQSSLLILSSNF